MNCASRCKGGVGATGKACPADGKQRCIKCDSGYKLVEGKCVSCPGKCGAPQYKGDGNCDDNNNNCGCKFDGGDCCGADVVKTYCKEVRMSVVCVRACVRACVCILV